MEICNVPWYRLPLRYQMQIRCAIYSAQNGAVFKMGPLKDIDYEMAAWVSIVRRFSFQVSVKLSKIKRNFISYVSFLRHI